MRDTSSIELGKLLITCNE